MNIAFLFIGLVIGALGVAVWLNKQLSASRNAAADREKQFLLDQAETDRKKSIVDETLRIKTEENARLTADLESARNSVASQSEKIARTSTENSYLREQLDQQKSELAELQKKLQTEFENIANRILKERSNEFVQHNEKNIGEILNPLREKIASFEKKVEEAYDKELRDKVSLREEVKKLTELNTRVSEEANNLTRALKGDVKKQGNWGEIILERVLERSGLTKGQEYEREEVVEGADMSVQRPDVILHLPDNKHIIVDSKVSLVAYERLMAAETDEQRALFQKEHIASLRSHVKLLSEKNYQNAHNLNTPDFVLMFVPIEASFSIAVQADNELFSYAWEKKIVIVSPTTLLATLRTISSIWKQENQSRNAQEIARLSGTLYDKLAGFVTDLGKIKDSIDKAGNSYDEAMKKLQNGNGNIFRTAERIKELGAKSNKQLPEDLIG
ncbi:DNA recombination protein RmuC [Paludibacter jiangxiensis]|uniref:DNA recombination protein RmuC n=1 Tax=Paludibacter jiangxiensis TaxID=681398 RepID=A0A171A5A7_9BACT|nr:DNA recombination protein RmuC [Paludibacter jiangxiensis]GAT63301.1 DNA recombination protein RmuC [Paludibacter jiangxiensis]